MKINIQIVSVDITTKMNKANKPYQQVTLAFRDLQQNKLKEKKILDFTDEGKLVYSTASGAQQGQTYSVDMEKIGEYWNWKNMIQEAPGSVPSQAGSPTSYGSKNVGTNTTARTYETAEERAERQVLIVRQSSLSAAVATLTAGAKTAVKSEDVLALADQYTKWVFQKEAKESFLNTFEEMDNDL